MCSEFVGRERQEGGRARQCAVAADERKLLKKIGAMGCSGRYFFFLQSVGVGSWITWNRKKLILFIAAVSPACYSASTIRELPREYGQLPAASDAENRCQ